MLLHDIKRTCKRSPISNNRRYVCVSADRVNFS